MRTTIVTENEVIEFFKEHRIVTWKQLTSHFGITRQALQRKIKNQERLKSLNHNRGYLTLRQFIGKTNQYGIWSHDEINFSIHGNTPETIIHIINTCEQGFSTKELTEITSVVCTTILLKLLKQGNITRIKEGYDYIYLSTTTEIRQAQLEKRGLTSQEPHVEAKRPFTSRKPDEIHNLLELGDEDYVLKRLEIVRRVKSGKSKAQVARELNITPDTVRNTYETFEKYGAKGLVITRKKKPYKMTESTEKEILIMKAKHPEWSLKMIGESLRDGGLDINDKSIRIYLEKIGLIPLKKTQHKT